mgnify:CR=1 FL=1
MVAVAHPLGRKPANEPSESWRRGARGGLEPIRQCVGSPLCQDPTRIASKGSRRRWKRGNGSEERWEFRQSYGREETPVWARGLGTPRTLGQLSLTYALWSLRTDLPGVSERCCATGNPLGLPITRPGHNEQLQFAPGRDGADRARFTRRSWYGAAWPPSAAQPR